MEIKLKKFKAFIFAGGKSSRMGSDKALIKHHEGGNWLTHKIKIFKNIFLRIDQGAESLLSKKKINIKTNRFRTLYPSKSLNVIVNTLSICFICIAIFLRKLYGAI